ncbi:hypothetical protein VTO42DRAFT_6581 [Malbranchea cinnamomea]
MGRLNSLLATILATAVPVITHDVRISMFDTQPASTTYHDQEVSSDVAELILKRRLGQPGSATLGEVKSEVISYLNELGGSKPGLFGGEDVDPIGKLLVVVEQADSVDASTLRASSTNDIVIKNTSPDFLSTFDVLNDFTLQGFESRLCFLKLGTEDGLTGRLVSTVPDGTTCFEQRETQSMPLKGILHDKSFQGFVGSVSRQGPAQLNVRPNTSSGIKNPQVANILSAVKKLSLDFGVESTVVFLPHRANLGNWDNDALKSRRNIHLEQQPSHIPTFQESGQSSSISDSTEADANDAISVPRKSPTLSTLMPVCYASNSSCNDATNNCSGHGYCYKKHGSKDGSNTAGDCYACKCARTIVRTNDDGTVKTVQWGGPACQKKDVSTPFFLLGGLTILLVVVIGGAIGMMFRMGQEELPGVLSAGVAPPKK